MNFLRAIMDSETNARCLAVTDKLLELPCAHFFKKAVDPKKDNLPDYFALIAHPRDLSTVRKNLVDNKYNSVGEWRRDLELIWSNAEKYNGEGDFVTMFAQEMRRKTESLTLSLSKSVPEWMTRVNYFFSRVNEITSSSSAPEGIAGTVKPFEDADFKAEKRAFLKAQGALSDRKDVANLTQVLTVMGVHVPRYKTNIEVDLHMLPPIALRPLAALAKENADKKRPSTKKHRR